MSEIINEILISVAVTILSASIIYFFRPIYSYIKDYIASKKIYNWLRKNSSKELGNTFRSTRAIASHCNFTEDRVRDLCSKHTKIFLSTGTKEDLWSIHARKPRGFFDP